jgi:hypothetical protein
MFQIEVALRAYLGAAAMILRSKSRSCCVFTSGAVALATCAVCLLHARTFVNCLGHDNAVTC